MKLKTLKDLHEIENSVGTRGVPHFLLKQEAIKWIKSFQTGADNRPAERGVIFWIKHFFNITEEELKK